MFRGFGASPGVRVLRLASWSEMKIGFNIKIHVLENCWVTDKDKLAPGGTKREEIARSLGEAQPISPRRGRARRRTPRAAPWPALVADDVTVGGGRMVTFVLFPGGRRLYFVLFYCVFFVCYFVKCIVTVGTTDLKGGGSVTMGEIGANVSRGFLGRRRGIWSVTWSHSGVRIASWSGEDLRVLYIED